MRHSRYTKAIQSNYYYRENSKGYKASALKKILGTNWKPISLVIATLFGFGVFVFLAATKEEGPKIDEVTLCPDDTRLITQSVTVLVDATDKLHNTYAKKLERLINKLVPRLPLYSKISVLSVGDRRTENLDGFYIKKELEKCTIKSGKDVSALTDSKKKYDAKWEKDFMEPLRNTLKNLEKIELSETTPLLEAIAEISNRDDLMLQGGNAQRLIIISDLLHHTKDFSHYRRRYSLKKLLDSDYFYRLHIADLPKNLSVEVIYVEREGQKTRNFQNKKLEQFWKDFFKEYKATKFKINYY